MGFYADVSAAEADGLLHYWPMNEASGTVIADSMLAAEFDAYLITTGYTAVDQDIGIVSGLFGNARDICPEGKTTASLIAAIRASHGLTGATANSRGHTRDSIFQDWTIRSVFNFRGYGNGGDSQLFSTTISLSSGTCSVWLYADGSIEVYKSGSSILTPTSTLPTGWNDLIITNSAANGLIVYLNGSVVGSGAGWSLQPYNADWFFGCRPEAPTSGSDWQFALDGIIDEQAVWSRELSSAEVTSINGSALIGSTPAPVSRVLYSDTSAALADNCLHYWRMDASEGANTITDSIGGYHGAVAPSFDVNGAVLVESTPMKEGRRIHFYTGMGTSDNAVLYCDPVAAGETSTQFWNASFRIRVKYDSITASGAMAASIGDRNSDLGSLAIYIRDLGSQPTCKWSRPNNPITGNIVDGSEWLEIVATSEGDSSGCTLRLYVNGLEIGSSVTGANRGGLNPYSQAIAFGGEYPVTVYSSDGVVDEAVFWSRTLSATEISDLYNSGASKFILPTLIAAERALEASWNVVNGVDYYLATSWNVESANYVYPPEIDLGKISETVRFRAILEGANDSLSDIEIPISSFNARLRSARDSYLSITAPSASALVPDIEARPNGELVVQQVEGDQITELARVNFQDLRVDKGAKAGTTLTLSGYKQKTYEAPSAWSIQNHSYFSRSGSKSRVRLQANSRIRPQDQITVEGLSFIIDTVTLIGSTSRVFMELSE